jgi:chromosome segregation ATPase
MLPLEVSMDAFKVIIQIVLWIAIPSILVATAFVYFLHYRKMRKSSMNEFRDTENQHNELAVSGIYQNESVKELPMASYDVEQLIDRYKREVISFHDKYELLYTEYAQLEEKYMALVNSHNANSVQLLSDSSSNEKLIEYENKITHLQKELQQHKDSEYSTVIKWGKMIREKETVLVEKENRLVTLEMELQRYSTETARLTEELDALKNSASATDIHAETDQLQNLLKEQLEETEKRYEKEISTLHSQIENANEEIRQLKEAANIAAQHIVNAGKAEELAITELRNKLSQASEEISRLKEAAKVAAAQPTTIIKVDETIAVELRNKLVKAQEEINHLKEASRVAAEHGTASKAGETIVAELQNKLVKAEEEKALLKNQITEDKFLHDLLQEKNAHINFLQVQLEQRLKNFRQLEHQHDNDVVAIKEMDAMVKKLETEIISLDQIVKQRELEVNETKNYLDEEKKLSKKYQQDMIAREATIEQMKIETGNLSLINTRFETTISGNNRTINGLSQELYVYKEKVAELEKKLEVSSQLLVKIYKDLARTLGTTIFNNMGQERIADKDGSVLNRTAGDSPLLAVKEGS